MNVTPLEQSVGRIGNWSQLPFFNNGQYNAVRAHLANETRPVIPDAGDILRAFELTHKSNVRVVIVGQDPYPNYSPQLATGLAFAVPSSTNPLPPSLDEIFSELPSSRQPNPNLENWAKCGVLLLNNTLTIPVDVSPSPQESKKHKRIGWSFLVRQAIESLANRNDVFFMFFGTRSRKMDIIPPNLSPDQMIRTGHPSRPHVTTRAPWVSFKGSDPFTKANQFFQSISQPLIVW